MNVKSPGAPVQIEGASVTFKCIDNGGAVDTVDIEIDGKPSFTLTPAHDVVSTLSKGDNDIFINIQVFGNPAGNLNRHYDIKITANDQEIASTVGDLAPKQKGDIGYAEVTIVIV